MAEKEELTRFGVSMPEGLVEQFDRLIAEQGYSNRSEAIRDLVRRSLLEPGGLRSEQAVAGTIVMVYNHHVSELPLYLMELQHQYHHEIISMMHVHLNHDQCLEVLMVRGKLASLRSLHQQIQIQRGVHYAELSVTYVEDQHGEESGHSHADGRVHSRGHRDGGKPGAD